MTYNDLSFESTVLSLSKNFLYGDNSIENRIETLIRKFKDADVLCAENSIRDKEINLNDVNPYATHIYIIQDFNKNGIVFDNIEQSKLKTIKKINSIKTFMDRNVYTGSKVTEELMTDITLIKSYLHRQATEIQNHIGALDSIRTPASSDYLKLITTYPGSVQAGFYFIKNELWRVRYNSSARKNEFHVLTKAGKKMKYIKMSDNVCKIFFEHKRVDENNIIDLAKKTRHCGICGRPIETQESIERGIGPVCFSKMKEIETGQEQRDYGNSVESNAAYILGPGIQTLGNVGNFYFDMKGGIL